MKLTIAYLALSANRGGHEAPNKYGLMVTHDLLQSDLVVLASYLDEVAARRTVLGRGYVAFLTT